MDEQQQAVKACCHAYHHKVHENTPLFLMHRAQVQGVQGILSERAHELFFFDPTPQYWSILYRNKEKEEGKRGVNVPLFSSLVVYLLDNMFSIKMKS